MRVLLVWGLTWLGASNAVAGGFASNEDFVVRTASDGEHVVDRAFAEEVARTAAQYRSKIATEWLGSSLPESVGRTYLTVMVTDSHDGGRTWPKNKITGEYHNVHLRTTREGALGGTLAHEVAHVVLATQYQPPNSLPPWATEGIASRYDDETRLTQRRRIMDWYARTGNWPDLSPVLEYRIIPAKEKSSYAISASITEFLLTRGDKATFLKFASSGGEAGWDRALSSMYNIRNVDQLQSLWERWASLPIRPAANRRHSEQATGN